MAVPATAYAEPTVGTVKAWGNNNSDQLGKPSVGATSSTPVDVLVDPDNGVKLSGVKEIVAGGESGYALLTDDTVKAWGNNDRVQLGNTSSAGTTSSTPVDVVDPDTGVKLSDVKAIAAGVSMAYALLEDGTVKAWGSNGSGQLGDTVTSETSTPVTVQVLTEEEEAVGVKVTAIAAGWDSAYALLSNGTVKAWGNNERGQLGVGITDNRSTPMTVPDLNNGGVKVTAIAAGWASGYALLSNGTVKAWGNNDSGQLGYGITGGISTPVTVSGLTGVREIAAGHRAAYALLENDGNDAVKA